MAFNDPPWHPTTNTVELKTVLKLIEELGEAVSASARVLMQGINEAQPVTGKINREWLEDELADIHCGMVLTINYYGLNIERMQNRTKSKAEQLIYWHKSD